MKLQPKKKKCLNKNYQLAPVQYQTKLVLLSSFLFFKFCTSLIPEWASFNEYNIYDCFNGLKCI